MDERNRKKSGIKKKNTKIKEKQIIKWKKRKIGKRGKIKKIKTIQKIEKKGKKKFVLTICLWKQVAGPHVVA